MWIYRLKAEYLLRPIEGVQALRHLFTELGRSFNRYTNLLAYFFSLNQHVSRGGARPELTAAERLALTRTGPHSDWITPCFTEFLQRHMELARAAGEIRTDVSAAARTLLFGALLKRFGAGGDAGRPRPARCRIRAHLHLTPRPSQAVNTIPPETAISSPRWTPILLHRAAEMDVEQVCAKARHLAEAVRLGHPVPDGFVIPR